ncbi:MAG: hypothetical protein KGJ86_17305, partial [Chloroflexota bacterium]|nr:hypothetical protein [Chloroflexota bacterium]
KSGKRRRRRTRVRPRDFVQGPQLSLFGDRAASDLRPGQRGTYQYRFGNPLRHGGQEAVSANIRQLYHEHGDEKAWPRERILAAAENAARGDRPRATPDVLTLSCARCGAHHRVLRGATHFTCRSCGSGNGIRRRR